MLVDDRQEMRTWLNNGDRIFKTEYVTINNLALQTGRKNIHVRLCFESDQDCMQWQQEVEGGTTQTMSAFSRYHKGLPASRGVVCPL